MSDEEVCLLEVLFYVEEIKEAIWENEFDKSQRPDKFNMGFFKVYWNTIKEDLVAYVNEFYSSHKLPKAILASFLTLIPKKERILKKLMIFVPFVWYQVCIRLW